VAIDEAQFFDNEIVSVCNQLANKGIRVIVAGLDMDYLGNPFGPIPNLMAIAEYVTKVHAVCKKSGNIANYSFRKNKKTDIVVIGEKDKYEPLSRAVFYKKMKKDK
jgi:thymidine kinase